MIRGTTVFFDLETGGVEPGHPNIQIAATAVRDWQEVASFERKILFDVDACDPDALALNGYSAEKWADAISEWDAMHAFDAFLLEHRDLRLISKKGRPYTVCRLAGHNVTHFDIPRVRDAMTVAGRGFWAGCWWYPLDTYSRAIWFFEERGLEPPENFQMQTLARYFGIPPQGEEHEALADVRTNVLVARALIQPDGSGLGGERLP